MNKKIEDMFKDLPQNDAVGIFMQFIELPDDQFDFAWPEIKEHFENVFTTEIYQKQALEAMEQFGNVDKAALLEQRSEYQKIIDEVSSEGEVSKNKIELLRILLMGACDVYEELYDSRRINIRVKVAKLNPDAILPEYAHSTDAGCDVCAVEETKIEPGETTIVKTGLAMAIPAGYEIQVRPRSGLSLKSKLRIANAPGTIDSEYRGEVGIIMTNTGDTPYVIDKGMKIAQLVIAPTPKIKWNLVDTVEDLGETDRGEGGFGSTGVKA